MSEAVGKQDSLGGNQTSSRDQIRSPGHPRENLSLDINISRWIRRMAIPILSTPFGRYVRSTRNLAIQVRPFGSNEAFMVQVNSPDVQVLTTLLVSHSYTNSYK